MQVLWYLTTSLAWKLYYSFSTSSRYMLSSEAQACNFIKKGTLAQVFSCEFWENFKGTFFTELLRWLILSDLVILQFCTFPDSRCITHEMITRH